MFISVNRTRLTLCLVCCLSLSLAPAQDKSVKPGVNESFRDPDVKQFEGRFEVESREEDLIFAGLVGMIDPPREDVRDAVQLCLIASIRPVMITGDHPETALAIAQELHIAGPESRVMSGQGLDSLTDDALAAEVGSISVYARVTAEHKLRVVRAVKAGGQIVAMTGDGVNDAPAVRAADIGIAM